MKIALLTFLIMALALTACGPSGTAQKEMEKFSGTPTPTFAPTPEQTPVPLSDIVNVDTSQDGPILSVNGEPTKTLNCDKYNQVSINGDNSVVTLKGACLRVTVNGDGNKITAEAADLFVFNGTGNRATYSRFINGIKPLVTDNQSGNEVSFVRAGSSREANTKK